MKLGKVSPPNRLLLHPLGLRGSDVRFHLANGLGGFYDKELAGEFLTEQRRRVGALSFPPFSWQSAASPTEADPLARADLFCV